MKRSLAIAGLVLAAMTANAHARLPDMQSIPDQYLGKWCAVDGVDRYELTRSNNCDPKNRATVAKHDFTDSNNNCKVRDIEYTYDFSKVEFRCWVKSVRDYEVFYLYMWDRKDGTQMLTTDDPNDRNDR
jgi:hypothetical protein